MRRLSPEKVRPESRTLRQVAALEVLERSPMAVERQLTALSSPLSRQSERGVHHRWWTLSSHTGAPAERPPGVLRRNFPCFVDLLLTWDLERKKPPLWAALKRLI